jgi:ubiquinone/menaquinone biosynthesis C-methylase UbiE
MSETPGFPSSPYSFDDLDFERLWQGRERTTELERWVVQDALRGTSPGSVLEIGPGSGRITPVLLDHFSEYIGLDASARIAERWAGRGPGGVALLVGDVHRLPFHDEIFDAVVAIRVFNFLVDPLGALREMRRVLRPSGTLLFSYFFCPSLATFVDALKAQNSSGLLGRIRHALQGPAPSGLPTRTLIHSLVRRAGFQEIVEVGTGLEDYRPFRWLPQALLRRVATMFPGSFFLPHVFLRARRGSNARAGGPPR